MARLARERGARAVTDVLVVGGGPAGSVAALTLAQRGVRTLVLDTKRFPRDKPCGGGIRHGVYRRFPELAGYLRASVAIHEIRRVLMEGPSGATVLADGDEPLYLTLRRTEFDAALLRRARAAGAEVVEGARVTEVRDRSRRAPSRPSRRGSSAGRRRPSPAEYDGSKEWGDDTRRLHRQTRRPANCELGHERLQEQVGRESV